MSLFGSIVLLGRQQLLLLPLVPALDHNKIVKKVTGTEQVVHNSRIYL